VSRGKQIRARARARRRADHAQGEQWSAVKAAAALVHKRDEVLARGSDNPLKITVEKAHLADTLARFTKRFVDHGADPDQARFLALTVVAHSSGLSHDTPDLIERLERQERHGQLSPLRVGEPYVISPTMHATVAAAAQTLNKDNVATWRTDDLLASHGVLLLPHIQLVHADGNQVPDEIVMLSWGTGSYVNPLDGHCYKALYLTVWFDADGPVQAPEFTAARNLAAKRGHPLPCFGVAASRRCTLDIGIEQTAARDGEDLMDVVSGVGGEQQSCTTTIGEYSGEVIDVVDIGEWAHRYLFAFMGLAQQRIATVQPFRELRPDGRKPLRYDDVRVVQLRSFSSLGEDTQGQSGHQHHHRWVVRMHKVNQWYPSEGVHKVIWRGPYIKGPSDAPLLAGEKVNALVR
jgi:hypothetical protein